MIGYYAHNISVCVIKYTRVKSCGQTSKSRDKAISDLQDKASEAQSGASFKEYLWKDRFFLIAVLVVVIPQLSFLTSWIMWPLRQFSTYVHELFHGIFALITGGGFDRMVMYADGGGTAFTRSYDGWPMAFVSAGGLIGPAILGAIILFFSRRFFMTHQLLRILAILMALSALLWARDWYTITFCVVAMLILGAMAFVPSKTAVRIFAQAIAIQLCLQNVLDFSYMFTESFERNGEILYSDTGNIAQTLGGSYLMWASLIALLTLAIIIFALLKSRPAD